MNSESEYSRLVREKREEANRPVYGRCNDCGTLYSMGQKPLVRVGDEFFCYRCSPHAAKVLAQLEDGNLE